MIRILGLGGKFYKTVSRPGVFYGKQDGEQKHVLRLVPDGAAAEIVVTCKGYSQCWE